MNQQKALFGLGRTMVSDAAAVELKKANSTPQEYFARHESGDWGDTPRQDKDMYLKGNIKTMDVLTVYTLSTGERIWVETNFGHTETLLYLPDEY